MEVEEKQAEEAIREAQAVGKVAARRLAFKDMGTAAQDIKWRSGSKAVVVISMGTDGNIHVGGAGLSPQLMRELACAAISASYSGPTSK